MDKLLKIFTKHLVWVGIGLIAFGVAPLFILDLVADGDQAAGLGLAWGLTVGAVSVGIGVLIMVIAGLKRAWEILVGDL